MTNILYDYVTGRHVAGKLRPWRTTRVMAPVWRATCSPQAFRALHVTDTRIVDTCSYGGRSSRGPPSVDLLGLNSSLI